MPIEKPGIFIHLHIEDRKGHDKDIKVLRNLLGRLWVWIRTGVWIKPDLFKQKISELVITKEGKIKAESIPYKPKVQKVFKETFVTRQIPGLREDWGQDDPEQLLDQNSKLYENVYDAKSWTEFTGYLGKLESTLEHLRRRKEDEMSHALYLAIDETVNRLVTVEDPLEELNSQKKLTELAKKYPLTFAQTTAKKDTEVLTENLKNKISDEFQKPYESVSQLISRLEFAARYPKLLTQETKKALETARKKEAITASFVFDRWLFDAREVLMNVELRDNFELSDPELRGQLTRLHDILNEKPMSTPLMKKLNKGTELKQLENELYKDIEQSLMIPYDRLETLKNTFNEVNHQESELTVEDLEEKLETLQQSSQKEKIEALREVLKEDGKLDWEIATAQLERDSEKAERLKSEKQDKTRLLAEMEEYYKIWGSLREELLAKDIEAVKEPVNIELLFETVDLFVKTKLEIDAKEFAAGKEPPIGFEEFMRSGKINQDYIDSIGKDLNGKGLNLKKLIYDSLRSIAIF